MYKNGRSQNSTWESFYILHATVGNKKYVKCQKRGHQQANNAVRMQVYYTKCLMDSVSSASIERIFSNFGNIHTKVCNRLGNSKTFKLVFSEVVLN